MLTHGSDCQRAGSGPLVALVAVSVDEGRRGAGTLRRSSLAMLLDRRRRIKEKSGCSALRWPGSQRPDLPGPCTAAPGGYDGGMNSF
jgi:hypothetical protein